MKIIHVLTRKNMLIGIVFCVVFLSGFKIGQAYANTPNLKYSTRASVVRLERSDWINSTTTTTIPLEPARVAPVTAQTIPVGAIEGDRYQWLMEAGIPPEQWVHVDYIISHESGWRPNAISPNGCIGLGQNCAWNGNYFLKDACPDWQQNPVCQLRRFNDYAIGKYGGWPQAYNYWISNRSW